MKPLVIYHDNCADGYAAAFAAWLKLGDEADYVQTQYGNIVGLGSPNGPDTNSVYWEGREVYILDFSFPKKHMDTLFTIAKRVVWLDHHKTAFEAWFGGALFEGDERHEQHDQARSIVLDFNKSGALLAWEYFHPGVEVPLLIRHVDDRDRWQFKIPGSRELHAALWARRPWTFDMWKCLFLNREDEWVSEGAAILRAHDQSVASVVEGGARACELYLPTGLTINDSWHVRGLAANCPPHLASDAGHELANRSGTFGLTWHLDRDLRCCCSLRSNGEYDVSAIAKAFGGGGHRNAAGFEVPVETLLGWLR